MEKLLPTADEAEERVGGWGGTEGKLADRKKYVLEMAVSGKHAGGKDIVRAAGAGVGSPQKMEGCGVYWA